MTHTVSNLHFGNALVHEILPGKMKRVGKVIDLLIGQECVVGLHLDDGGRPVKRPILVGVGPFETVLIQQLLYQLHCSVLELVEIADFVMFGHVAYL